MSNTDFSGADEALLGLQRLGADGTVRPWAVIERGGIRFGILGVLGKESVFYTATQVP